MRYLILLFGLIVLCGCTSVQLADSSIKPIVLKQSYQRVYRGFGLDTIHVPAGIYQPDFTTKDGVYYSAPTHLTSRWLGDTLLITGGLYIPNPSDSDQRQGIWNDQSKTDVLRFKEPIPFEIENP